MKIQTKRLDILNLSITLWRDFYLYRDKFEMQLGLDPSLSLMPDDYLREYRDLLPAMLRRAKNDQENLHWYTQWVCVDRERHLLVGAFNFLGPPTSDGGIFMAFFGATVYADEKYMEEALQGLLSWLLLQSHVKYVCCETTRADLEEIHLLETVGFERGEQGNATILWLYEPRRNKTNHPRKLTF